VSERKKRQGQPRPPSPGPSTSLYERYKDALRRGHVAALRGRLEPAIDAYGEAASIAPDRALPHAAIGGILVRMGRMPDALAAYDRALELARRDETALRGRAEALRSLGRRTDAADTLDRLAEVLDGVGRLPDATDAARRALELAESKERRRYVESLAARLRESAGDEAGQRALAAVLRILEPAVVTPPDESAPPAVAREVADEASVAEPVPPAEPLAEPEPSPEPQPEPEPLDGTVLAAAAEAALDAGDAAAAREGLVAAATAYQRTGRPFAAIDACYLALAVAPADADLHLLLADLYLESGWRGPAVEKLLLLGRLAELDEDAGARERLCRMVGERLPDEPRLASLCVLGPVASQSSASDLGGPPG
jgi:tetratricopeptide (TPR) repeat protein